MSKISLFEKVYYSSERFKYVDEFFNTKEEVFKQLSNTGYTGEKVGGKVREVENTIIKNLNIKDLRNKAGEKTEEIVSLIRNIKIEDRGTKVIIKIDTNGTFKVIIKGNRLCCTVLEEIDITPNTIFTLRDRLRAYNNERLSIAIIGDEVGISLGVFTGATEIKGKAQAVVKLLKPNELIIDDLSKYMDTTVLLSGMAP